MYHLNLGYYSVEQESGYTNPFDSWSSNNKSALNDVVDPNTEFKITPSNFVPVSTLESYGFSKANPNPGAAFTTDSAHIIVSKTKYASTMPTNAQGNAIRAQQKVRNSLSISQEIPQVHGSKRTISIGCLSNGSHTAKGISPRTKQTPTNDAEAVSKRKQYSSVTKTGRDRQDNGCETLSLDGDATTASQLAWAFRRDRADLDSNTSRCSSRFDLESNFSERADTFSTLSGVSGYEEELFRIRRLLLLDTARSYQETLLEDSDRKSSASKEEISLRNESSKGLLGDANDTAEPSSPDWHREQEHAVCKKVSASARLQEVHAEVEALRQALSEKTSLQRQAEDGKGLPTDLAAANERLRIQMQELRLDAESKDSAVRGLKLKVAAQHADLEALRTLHRAAESRCASRRNEADAARKSAASYRQQLHAARAAGLQAEQALTAARGAAVSANHAAARLADETVAARELLEETRRRAVAEKDGLVRKLEAIHAGMVEREAAILENLRAAPAPVHGKKRASLSSSNDSETAAAELRAALDERDGEILALRSTNVELAARFNDLQVAASERTASEADSRRRLRDLEAACDTATRKLSASEATVLRIANDKAELEVALTTATREKAEVDAAVELLRENFAQIERQYQTMQDELAAKDAACQRKDAIVGLADVEAGLRRMLPSLTEINATEAQLRELRTELVLASQGPTDAEELDASLLGQRLVARAHCIVERVEAVSSQWRALDCLALQTSIESLVGKLPLLSAAAGPGRAAEEVSELARLRAEAADTLDGVRVALGRSEAMGGVLRTSVSRLQGRLDAEQLAHENCRAECERLRAAVEDTQDEFPPDWEAELAALRADKAALQAQVGELREATQSTLQQNKLLRLRLDVQAKPPPTDRLPPPPPPPALRYDALLQSAERGLPLNEPLADLQGCLDSLKTEMATLQQQLMAKARGEDKRFDA